MWSGCGCGDKRSKGPSTGAFQSTGFVWDQPREQSPGRHGNGEAFTAFRGLMHGLAVLSFATTADIGDEGNILVRCIDYFALQWRFSACGSPPLWGGQAALSQGLHIRYPACQIF